MSKFAYVGVLLACLIGTAWLEYFLRTKVYRRTIRLFLTVLPVALAFSIWDAYAIAQGHWKFDSRYVTGITTFANIPLDEILFFIVIPICSILSFEAVRSARNWQAGDEGKN
ncbi:MAG: lycopene cyclase domain-containing protein [Actinobacteria bacterium]|nr:lycopene cyclase domain-containing protein [Actinomycetota bacterium]NBO34379.1 lycopene cyclase domain-containing protein [Actinomycetota bacterium]